MNLILAALSVIAFLEINYPDDSVIVYVCVIDEYTTCESKYIYIDRDEYGNLTKETIKNLGGSI